LISWSIMPRRQARSLCTTPFWNKSLTICRAVYGWFTISVHCELLCAPLLIAADGALVVNVSYYGAVSYHLDPAYGATKAGLDKLTFDMAQDFKPYITLQWCRSGPADSHGEIQVRHREDPWG